MINSKSNQHFQPTPTLTKIWRKPRETSFFWPLRRLGFLSFLHRLGTQQPHDLGPRARMWETCGFQEGNRVHSNIQEFQGQKMTFCLMLFGFFCTLSFFGYFVITYFSFFWLFVSFMRLLRVNEKPKEAKGHVSPAPFHPRKLTWNLKMNP